MNNRKFIIWDWNGTLLDDADIVLECINLTLGNVQMAPISLEKLRNTQSTPFTTLYTCLGVPKEKIDYLIKNSHIFHEIYESRVSRASLRSGTSALLKRLKANNVSNTIVSNHIADKIIKELERHGIFSFFDKVMAYANPSSQFHDITKGERVRRHIENEQLNVSNAVIVGDTREEIRIARDLGMTSVAITGGILSESLLREEKPDYVVHSIDDLGALLQERKFVA